MFLVPMTRESRDLARSFERLFDDAFGGSFFTGLPATRGDGNAPRSPALDLVESDRAYTVKLEMPGVKKEDVKVTIDGARVSVSAQSERNEEKKEGDRVVYRERSLSSYARSFTLPAEVDQAGAAAKLDNGVLVLELPKRATTAAKAISVA
ncbi:MAG: Hsp20/alpha crystallin family protein [Rubrivivax sp.]|nr:Hsp20/alpha crystallin family protein [Rubrivivax sp.]